MNTEPNTEPDRAPADEPLAEPRSPEDTDEFDRDHQELARDPLNGEPRENTTAEPLEPPD